MGTLGRLFAITVVVLIVQVQTISLSQAQLAPTAPPHGRMVLGDGTLWYMSQAPDEDHPFTLYALDPATGATKGTFHGTTGGEVLAAIGDLGFVKTTDDAIIAFDASARRERWRYQAPHFVLIAGVDENNIYLCEDLYDSSGWFSPAKFQTIALDVETGAIRWSREPGSSWMLFGDGIVVEESSTGYVALETDTGHIRWRSEDPGFALVGDRFIIDTDFKSVYARDTVTGKPVWNVNVVREAVNFDGGVTFVSADTVYGVYQFPETFSFPEHYLRPSFVLALDIVTGEERWRFPEQGDFFTGVATSIVADSEAVFIENKGRYVALDVATGELLWQRDAPGYGYVSLLGPSSVLITSRVGYVDEPASIYALSRTTGDLAWSYQAEGYLRDQVIVSGGQVFALTGEYGGGLDTIVAIEEASGAIIWKQDPGDEPYLMQAMVALAVAALAAVSYRRLRETRPAIPGPFQGSPQVSPQD